MGLEVSPPGSDRGQTELLSLVLIVAITISGISGVMVYGVQSLDDAKRSAYGTSAEHAYTQLDSRISLVAHQSAPSQTMAIAQDPSADQYVSSAGWMNISIESPDGDVKTINQSLGAIVYETDDTEIAYQGGGVWEKVDGGSTMISPPEFHYNGETLTLPIIAISGSGPVTDELSFERTGGTVHYPSDEFANPLAGGNVTITVESEYSEAWGHFFEERTRGAVDYPNDRTVRVRPRVEQLHPALRSSFGGFAAAGQSLSMGGFDAFTADSYDSREGAYDPADANRNARVTSTNDVHFASGGGQPDPFWINGTLAMSGDSFNPSDLRDHVDTIEYGADVEELEASGYIRNQVAAFGGEQSLDDDGTIDAERVEVSAGDYHVGGDLELTNGAELAIDTTGGDVDIRIDGDFELSDSNVTITSNGANRATVWVNGDVRMEEDVNVADNADDNANLFWLYFAEDLHLGVDEGNAPRSAIDYTGVLYGPESEAFMDEADVTVKGSVSTGTTGSGPGNQNNIDDVSLHLHYDERLTDEKPFGGEPVATINFLHISTSEISVEG